MIVVAVAVAVAIVVVVVVVTDKTINNAFAATAAARNDAGTEGPTPPESILSGGVVDRILPDDLVVPILFLTLLVLQWCIVVMGV